MRISITGPGRAQPVDSRCQSFTAQRGPVLIDDVNSSQIGEAQLAHFADLARSITGCAARHSNASRYNQSVIPPIISIWLFMNIKVCGPQVNCEEL